MRLPVMGGPDGTLYQPDATADFANSADSGVVCEHIGPTRTPVGAAGEAVFRLAYIIVTHTGGASFWFTPIVDGKRITELRTYCSRPATSDGQEERYEFRVPLAVRGKQFTNVVVGLRGTAVACHIEATDPSEPFTIEDVIFAHEALAPTRAKKAAE